MTTTSAAPQLPAGYYLDNFETVCRWVRPRYADLLSPEEHAWFEAFDACDLSARRLFVRLVLRRGPVFRLDTLAYPEIGEPGAPAAQLVRHGLATLDPALSVHDAASLLTKAELVAALGDPVRDADLRRPELILALLGEHGDADVSEQLAIRTLRVDAQPWIDRLCLLFFGNGFQGFEQFVRSDLGLARYEDYPIDAGTRLFASRPELEQALVMHAVLERMWARTRWTRADIESMFGELDTPFAAPVLEHQRQGVINELARGFERCGCDERALELYATTTRPPSRERRARIHARQKNRHLAVAMCDEILEAPLSEPERSFAVAFRRKLRRRPRPRVHLPSRELEVEPGGERIERRALAAYEREGWRGFYVENHLLNALWGLLMWEEMFSPAPGAFVHPFQSGPLDLFTPAFRERSAGSLRRRLESLDLGSILARFRARHGVANVMVRWSALSEELLRLTLRLVPRQHLVDMLDRLGFDLANNRSGLPDLVLFDEDAGSYRFVEVKGPGDRLQPGQRAWFEFFVERGIACEVAFTREVPRVAPGPESVSIPAPT